MSDDFPFIEVARAILQQPSSEKRRMTTVNDIIESLKRDLWIVSPNECYLMRDTRWICLSSMAIIFNPLDYSSTVYIHGFIDRLRLRFAVWKWKKTTQEKK